MQKIKIKLKLINMKIFFYINRVLVSLRFRLRFLGLRVRFNIDHFIQRGPVFFGHAWVLDRARLVTGIKVHLDYFDGQNCVYGCQHSLPRADIAAFHAEIPHAANSGFVFSGRLRAESSLSDAYFEISFDQGEPLIMRFFDRFGRLDQASTSAGWWSRLQRLWAGGSAPHTPADAETDRSGIGAAPVAIIFDHAMGGGANHYRRDLVDKWVAQGVTCAVVTPNLNALKYNLRIHSLGGQAGREFESLAEILNHLETLNISSIFISNLVSFENPVHILGWIVKLNEQRQVKLNAFFHDFYPVCPSWTLLNADGQFCNIPSVDVCGPCLSRQDTPFLGLLGPVSIESWRQAWAEVLVRADEVVCFSRSSMDLVRRAFPAILPARVKHRPHQTPSPIVSESYIPPAIGAPLVIGIIGTIDRHKGAEIVAQMAAIIARQGLDIRIVVCGTLAAPCDSNVVTITGAYDVQRLPQILAGHHVNLCLLPSIWPETFSYVAQEIMVMGYPLAVFDLGAPAERVRHYQRGLILPQIDAADALARLIGYHRDSRGLQTPDGEAGAARPAHAGQPA
jgi:glycosyltransferase involved in cell wall biosynthesis